MSNNTIIYGNGQVPSWYVIDKTYTGLSSEMQPETDGVALGRFVLLKYCDTAFSFQEKEMIKEKAKNATLEGDEALWYNRYIQDKRDKDQMLFQKVFENNILKYREIGFTTANQQSIAAGLEERVVELEKFFDIAPGETLDETLDTLIEIQEGMVGKNTPEGGEIFNDYNERTITDNSAIIGNVASNSYAHAEGRGVTASGVSSHAEGVETEASGHTSHAEGNNTKALGMQNHAEGRGTTANGGYGAHAEGLSTQALGDHGPHSEGWETLAQGEASHAEGYKAQATAMASHAEGSGVASGSYSHAEGSGKAMALAAHAEGGSTEATADSAHAEGRGTKAKHKYSHASGYATTTGKDAQTVMGLYNAITDTALLVVGNGTPHVRRNAFEVLQNGSFIGTPQLLSKTLVNNNTPIFTYAENVQDPVLNLNSNYYLTANQYSTQFELINPIMFKFKDGVAVEQGNSVFLGISFNSNILNPANSTKAISQGSGYAVIASESGQSSILLPTKFYLEGNELHWFNGETGNIKELVILDFKIECENTTLS